MDYKHISPQLASGVADQYTCMVGYERPAMKRPNLTNKIDNARIGPLRYATGSGSHSLLQGSYKGAVLITVCAY